MATALPLRAALTRGALVTLANWPVVMIDFAIESLYKLALLVPIVGGAFMVAVLAGVDAGALFDEGVRAAAQEVIALLANAPAALASFVLAMLVVAYGGALIMFFMKAGTLSVLIDGERRAAAIESPPFRFAVLPRTYVFSVPAVLEGARRFGRRGVTLVTWLGVAYALVGAAYIAAMRWAVEIAAGRWASSWPIIVLVATSAAVVAVVAINLVYDLLRIIVVSDDCGVRAALKRLRGFLVADARQVLGLFGVVGGLLTVAAAISIVATASLALVAWVPVVGLVVVPLQLAAWLVRGLVFQYLSTAALSAYQTQYRRFAEPAAVSLPSRPVLVQHA